MKQLRANQYGFGAVEIIIICLVVAVIGAAGFLVFKKLSGTNIEATSTTQDAAAPAKKKEKSPVTQAYVPVIPSGWNVYKSQQYGFSFAYPREWGDLSDESRPGGSFDATKDWLVHSASSEIERNSAGIAGRLILDVNTKSYQEFRTQKAGTPHVYAVKDGKEYWAASATVDVEFDDYSPGDQYPVPIEKTIKGTNIYKLYSDYEGGVSAGWRFPVKNGIVTIWLPGLYAYNMVTGEITGDTDAYKKLHADILKSIDITQ